MAKFMDYLDTSMTLGERLQLAFDELCITMEQQVAIMAFLAPLGVKDQATLEHSIRVGLLARGIARCMHLDQKAMLYAGLLHDVGKAQTPLSTLQKTEGWNSADQELIMQHVMDGYRLIRDKFDFSAAIILWHHRFQKAGYPQEFPSALHEYCEGTKVMIPWFGRMLALADCFDAIHRVNDKFDSTQEFTRELVREKMLQYNSDQKVLISELYEAKVFV